ncbi:ClpP-like prohead protease/major capsid protein fusion protein [uncultured Zhongshania sp.]|uniref:ClpP-like prohead protease/major capsid protein fusion protein n=1 Tax=uncultured Zhongshania sp. TaxID=1642288 RepID=UPI0030DDBCEC
MKNWYEMSLTSLEGAAETTAEIYVYDYIGYYGVEAKQFAKDLKALGDVSHIKLRINSPGGSVFEGTAIYNLLKEHPATIEAWIDGLAASMATVIALAAETVHIAENAYFMIHNPSGGAYGDERAMEKAKSQLNKVTKTMINLYSTRSGLSEDEVATMMNDETWFVGQEAVDAGFATDTTAAIEMAASYGPDLLNNFKNTPEAILNVATASTDNIFFPSAVAGTQPKQEAKPMDPKNPKPVATADDEAIVTPEMRAAIVAEAQQAEATRRTEIKAVFKGFDAHSDVMTACLDDMNCDAQGAKDKLLAALGSSNSQPGHSYSIVVQDGDGIARMKAHAENTIAMRALGAKREENNELAGYTMFELARMMLHARNVNTGGMDKMALVAAAFTHSSGDFTTVLGNIAHKAMLKGYEEADEVFQRFTSVGSFSDFKVHTRTDLGSFPSLRQVGAGAEFKYVTIGERAETSVLATYGELFSINRQAIINDDLGLFTRLPQKMGRAAVRTVGDLVFSIFLNNPAMADTVALFHADHNNLLTAAGINTTSVDLARVKMAVQAEGNAKLNLRPKFLLCDVADEGAAKVTLESEYEVGASAKNNTVPNSVRGIAEVISDARLSGHNGWYLLADQNMHDTIEVQYLDGNQAPVLEQQNGWNVDGTEFKVRMDAAAKAWDFRGMTKTPKS